MRHGLAAWALLLLAGCSPGPMAGGAWPQELAGWEVLQVRDGLLVPDADAVVYDLATPLFSDYAGKYRSMHLPPGGQVSVAADGRLGFPVGTVLTKTFWYRDNQGALAAADGAPSPPAGLPLTGVRLLETRVLAHTADGWQAASYVWQDGVATLAPAGALLPVDLADQAPGSYLVPDRLQCAGCHVLDEASGALQPIGPHLANLRQGRSALAARGALPETLPVVAAWPAWDDAAAPVDARARAYLEVNCAHCHRAGGAADTSGLLLTADEQRATSLGICKPPVAAGRGSGGLQFAVLPGAPDASILVHRMASTDPGVMMPELGRRLAHDAGVALVSAWVASLTGDCG